MQTDNPPSLKWWAKIKCPRGDITKKTTVLTVGGKAMLAYAFILNILQILAHPDSDKKNINNVSSSP